MDFWAGYFVGFCAGLFFVWLQKKLIEYRSSKGRA